MIDDNEVDVNSDIENQSSIENSKENRDVDIEQETRLELGTEETGHFFEDGFLAEMYRRVENGNEDGAPGWDPKMSYYENR